MTRSKIAAFLEEFKLKDFFAENEVNAVHVSRIPEECMDETPTQLKTTLFLEDVRAWKRFILLDQDHHRVLEVGVEPIERKWYLPSTWDGEIHFQETVSAALIRLGEKAEAHIIVIDEPVILNYRLLHNITVLKSPKGFTAQEWLEEIKRRDRVAIKSAVAEIDNI